MRPMLSVLQARDLREGERPMGAGGRWNRRAWPRFGGEALGGGLSAFDPVVVDGLPEVRDARMDGGGVADGLQQAARAVVETAGVARDEP